MKHFTKIALILSLVLIILGSMFCMISLCVGFNYEDFWEDVEMGKFSIGPIENIPIVSSRGRLNWRDDKEHWNSAETKEYAFQWRGNTQDAQVRRLEVEVYYGSVKIEENTENTEEIQIIVEYRKKNHKRNVEISKDGVSLKIKETGSRRSVTNDSTRITVLVPAQMQGLDHVMEEISLKQDAGEIFLHTPLTAEEININVGAGECQVFSKLKALKECKAQVGAGEIDLNEIEAPEVELRASVGEIDTGIIIADDVSIDCGIGSIDAVLDGSEQDYNYEISCSVGAVEIGDSSYAGFGSKRKIENSGNKKVKVECGIGEVDVSFGRKDIGRADVSFERKGIKKADVSFERKDI